MYTQKQQTINSLDQTCQLNLWFVTLSDSCRVCIGTCKTMNNDTHPHLSIIKTLPPISFKEGDMVFRSVDVAFPLYICYT